MWLDFDVRDDSRCTLSLRKSYYRLWTLLCLSYKRLNAGFVSSPDVNWWTGVLWCLYQTLILTAPIHCRAYIPETHFVLQIRWRNKLHFWWPENEHILIYGWTILSNTHFTSKTWHSDAEKANVGQDLNRWDGETCRYKIKLLYLYGILWRQAFTLCHIFSLTLMIVYRVQYEHVLDRFHERLVRFRCSRAVWSSDEYFTVGSNKDLICCRVTCRSFSMPRRLY